MRKTGRYFILILLTVFSLVPGGKGVSLATPSNNQKSIVPILSYLLLQANSIKIDNYVAMGDSITKGLIYDAEANGYYTLGGYVPPLTGLLTSSLGYSVMIVNEGIGGTLSAEGVEIIPSLLDNNKDSQRFLVQYGTNDANRPLPVPSGKGLDSDDPAYPGTFKDNMQQIITAVKAEDKEIYLAKPPVILGSTNTGPPFGDFSTIEAHPRNISIREYGYVIDVLILENDIAIAAADFYELFNEIVETDPEKRRYENEYSDNLHPNNTGYQSMAELWHQKLINGI